MRILVGLSGGVDSAVAAMLLARAGHAVEGAYLRTWMNEPEVFAPCPWETDLADARATAAALGLPFRVVNLIERYRERVVRYLVEGYRRGLTPNPDIMCNREMKFGVFVELARAEGFDAVATGHYVRRGEAPPGSVRLLEGADPLKDQSYFLALVRPELARHAHFPVGHLRKAEVRALARAAALPVAEKKDSQGICFLGSKVRLGEFLRQFIPDRPGDIVTLDGRVVGRHAGLHRYTLGQRKGLGVPSNTDHEAFVIVAKDVERNELRVAFDHPETPGLWRREARLHGLSWLRHPAGGGAAEGGQDAAAVEGVTAVEGVAGAVFRLRARPRYRDPAFPATLTLTGPETAELVFDEPQRALAPGQICALYDGPELLGGGVFT